jgi:hypothetical protein
MACEECTCSKADPAAGKEWGPQIFDPSTYREPAPDHLRFSRQGWTWTSGDKRPNIYSNPLPPWPTLEEIRKVVREEIQKHDG